MMALLYLSQKLSEDVENQKTGLVIVLFPTSSFDIRSIAEPEAQQDKRAIISSTPVRASAIHICLPDTPFCRFIGALYKVIFPTELAVRIRIHTGKFQFKNWVD